ncbi:histidine kinase dimerization/phospho-acceptor domain-containing protein, partial [Thomasclavelia ramosa]
QRKSFFAAVSHELKTPITIMKAQSENMLYRIGDYANRDKYLQENLLVLDEMEKLVKEIILIAKLDASDIDQPFEQINLEQILVPCVK